MKNLYKLIFGLFLLMFSNTIATTQTLYISSSGSDYPNECFMNITTGANGTGTVVWQQSTALTTCDLSGGGHITDVMVNVSAYCGQNLYVNAYDRWADSWNGGTYEIWSAPGQTGTLIANNGGNVPDDGSASGSSLFCNDPDELESSESFAACTCVPPSASYALDANCPTDFYIDVMLTDLGSATAVDITDGTTTFFSNVSSLQTYNIGPFALGTNVTILVNGSNYGGCDTVSPTSYTESCACTSTPTANVNSNSLNCPAGDYTIDVTVTNFGDGTGANIYIDNVLQQNNALLNNTYSFTNQSQGSHTITIEATGGTFVTCTSNYTTNEACNGGDICAQAVNILGVNSLGDLTVANDETGIPAGQFIYNYNNTSRIFMCDPSFNTSGSWSDNKDLWYVIDIPDGANEFTVSFTGLSCEVFVLPYTGTCGNLTEMPIGNNDSAGFGDPCFDGAGEGITDGFPIAEPGNPSITFRDNSGGTCTTIEDASTAPIYLKIVGYGGSNGTASPMPCSTVPACNFTITASAPQQNDECSTAVDATKNYTGTTQAGDFTQASDEGSFPNPTSCEGQSITTDGNDLWYIANLPPDNDSGNIGEMDVIVTASNTTDEIYVEIYSNCFGNAENCVTLNGTDGYADIFESSAGGGWWGNQANTTDSPQYLRVLSNGGSTFNFCAEVVVKNNSCERVGVLGYDPTFGTQVGDFRWTSLNGDGTRDLWYQFFSGTSKELDVTLSLPAGQTADIEIYENDCNNLTLAGSEAGFTGNSTRRLGCLETGENYYIRVVLTSGSPTAGTFSLDVVTLTGVPINDECQASTYDTDYDITNTTQNGNLPLGTPCEHPQATCDTGVEGEDLWYWFTLPGNPCTDDLNTTNIATISYDLEDKEAYIIVYDGSSCSTLSAEACQTISNMGTVTFSNLTNTGFDSRKLVRIIQKNEGNPVNNFSLGPVTFGDSPCNDTVDDVYSITNINSGSDYSTCFNGPYNATGATATTGTNNNVWFEFTAPDNADEEGYVSIYVQSLSMSGSIPYFLDIQVYQEVGGVGGIVQVGSGSTNTDGDGWVDLGHLDPGEDYFIEIEHSQSSTTEVLYDLCIYDSPTQAVDCPESNYSINPTDGVQCGDLANDCGLYYRIEIPDNTPSAWYLFEAIGDGIPLDIRVYGQGSDSPSGDGNATDYDQPCNPMLANIITAGPTGATAQTDVDACFSPDPTPAGSAGEYATYNLIGGSGIESNYYYLEVRHGTNAGPGCDLTADDICSITMAGPFTSSTLATSGGTPDGVCSTCTISAVSTIGSTPCDAASNTYSLDLLIYYSQAPTSGTLDVNGQSFPITGSPLQVTLTGLPADGNPVDLNISFSADASCSLTANNFFVAPNGCVPVCGINSIVATSNQTACNSSTNTYSQELIISYVNAPSSGSLIVNGQSFAITGSPQTITLMGLVADGNPVNVSASFSADATCALAETALFTAPSNCLCSISGVATGPTQTTCNPSTITYNQDIIVTYDNAPSSGTLNVNGQSFAITSSPQLVTLTGLIADGNPVNVTASFSADAACSFSTIALFDAPENCQCSLDDIQAGALASPCNSTTNTYDQDVIIFYTNPPSFGTLDVNGQSFAITSSPQTVTLTGLVADGNIVNVTASFSADGACSLTENSVFTAPQDCLPCTISGGVTASSQTACNSSTNTYTQTLVITYANPPASGTLDVNGQSFAITGSPQTVTLTGLVADSNPVNVNVSFSADPTCSLTASNVFTAPDNCEPCLISGLTAGNQGPCNAATDTYTQDITISYSNPPSSGTLNVNGQSFAITGSPQTLTLNSLPSDGMPVNVTASFSADAACSFAQNNLFVAPGSCAPRCMISSIVAGVQGVCDVATGTYSQDIVITYSDEPSTGSLYINGAFYPITGSPQTITLTDLTADGGNVNVFAAFTSNAACSYSGSNVFTAPTACPSCTDGIQNGQETGVDCGGPDCPPCSFNCALSNYYTGTLLTGEYSTGLYIGTNATVFNGFDVEFYSSCIAMEAGFEVKLGGEYLADPVPCGPNFAGSNPQSLSSTDSDYLDMNVSLTDEQGIEIDYSIPENGPVIVELLSIDGKMIRTKSFTSNQIISLDASKLPKGVYLVNLKTIRGVLTQKIALME